MMERCPSCRHQLKFDDVGEPKLCGGFCKWTPMITAMDLAVVLQVPLKDIQSKLKLGDKGVGSKFHYVSFGRAFALAKENGVNLLDHAITTADLDMDQESSLKAASKPGGVIIVGKDGYSFRMSIPSTPIADSEPDAWSYQDSTVRIIADGTIVLHRDVFGETKMFYIPETPTALLGFVDWLATRPQIDKVILRAVIQLVSKFRGWDIHPFKEEK